MLPFINYADYNLETHYFIPHHLFIIFRSAEDEQAVGASYCQSLHDLLRLSDFVVIAVNLKPDTVGLIGYRELSLMKPTAILVNISRGKSNPSPGLYWAWFLRASINNTALFSCLRSSSWPGCSSRSSPVGNNSCSSVGCDSSWTFTEVSSLWKDSLCRITSWLE